MAQASETNLKLYSREEVSQHNKEGDCWIIIGEKVYDVSKFAALHPAGKKIIQDQAGKDATELFKYFHNIKQVEHKYKKLVIGRIEVPVEQKAPILNFKNSFGDGIPFGDPNYVQGWLSPYFDDTHRKLRVIVRDFIEKEVEPFVDQWEEEGAVPNSIIKRIGSEGLFNFAGGKPWPYKFYPEIIILGHKFEKFDSFHEFIFVDEFHRIGACGIARGIFSGPCIGLPPVTKFGSDDLQQRVMVPVLKGDKQICLAITEPYGGSDVANLQCTAVLSEDKQYYVVNGLKKWISQGFTSDFFTTAVRTGGKGMKGISLLVIEKEFPGIKLKKMKCSGDWGGATAFIIFENVKVPVQNLIGKEGKGFQYIMINFNHERLSMNMQALRYARVCLEESMKFAHKRKTFGKKLIEHPVIRNKLANMARQVESAQAYLEQCIYNFDQMPAMQQNIQLSGSIALLKVQITQTLEFCAREAVQIFGGLGYTRGGQGGKVERIYREAKGMSIPGGSEEIMLDLGIRMASKMMPQL